MVKEPEKPAETEDGEAKEGAEASADTGEKAPTEGDKAESDKSKEDDKSSSEKK